MIDYETFSKIHDCHFRQGLTIAQAARALGLDPRTVATWVARSRFEPRRSRPRGSVLDPFKPRITRLLDTHPYSAQQIFQRLREEGYRGGVTILRDYVRRIRPTKRPVYLKLHFAPGECAQVDWGAYGTVAVGNTRRRLSFFVMVLAFSRQMFVEFTVSQTTEHFLACHEHGFAALGGVPSKIMVDNLKSAVLQRWPAPHRCSIRAISTLPATTALRSRPAMSPAAMRRVAWSQVWATSKRISCMGSS
ncbi:MAG: IS21 family transposase [Burkholderiaceae bacterium]